MGCNLNWFQNGDHPPCSTTKEVGRYQEVHEIIRSAPWDNLSALTGCLQKCTTLKYGVSFSSDYVHWDKPWISELMVQPDGSLQEEVVEYLAYDSLDLLGDLGGYLGLFLGWSLLSVGLFTPTIFRKIFSFITAQLRYFNH